MRIGILGAGAVGGYYGARLAAAGHSVLFVARGDRLVGLQARGLFVESIDGDLRLPPMASDWSVTPSEVSVAASGPFSDGPALDLVLVCVKAHHTATAATDVLALVTPRTDVLCLQNGVDQEATLDQVLGERLGGATVLPGICAIGVDMPEPGLVRHTNNGWITLGEWSGQSDRSERVATVLEDAGIKVRRSEDMRTTRWRKLIWNAAFNPIAALTHQSVLDVVVDERTRALAEAAMRETIAVGLAQGLAVAEYDLALATRHDPRWADSLTSMRQDVERGRPTEIEALTGVVIRRGRAAGVPTPACEVLHALVLAIERRTAAGPERSPTPSTR